jgi:hypothetical protein
VRFRLAVGVCSSFSLPCLAMGRRGVGRGAQKRCMILPMSSSFACIVCVLSLPPRDLEPCRFTPT